MTTHTSDSVEGLRRLSGVLASRDDDGLESVMHHAAERCSSDAVEEVILQSYLFLGYPIALNAMARWRAISGAHPPEDAAVDRDTWLQRGQAGCASVSGGPSQRPPANGRRSIVWFGPMPSPDKCVSVNTAKSSEKLLW